MGTTTTTTKILKNPILREQQKDLIECARLHRGRPCVDDPQVGENQNIPHTRGRARARAHTQTHMCTRTPTNVFLFICFILFFFWKIAQNKPSPVHMRSARTPTNVLPKVERTLILVSQLVLFCFVSCLSLSPVLHGREARIDLPDPRT